jgi:hypothetical protein
MKFSCLVFITASIVGIFPVACSGEPAAYPPTISLAEIRQHVDKCSHDHPRLLTTREELAHLSKSLDQDPLRKELADYVVRQATLLHEEKPVERKLTGRRLLSVSRTCLQRVLALATAYHLTGDDRHAARCREEMLAAARFSDWNPSHFLDVAEMTFALAIGYDWLYDRLDANSRKEIRTAIVEKGVKLPLETKYNSWVRARNNWGQVCHGGLTAGALAVLEDEPDLAARTVENALKNVTVAMAAYAPNGSFPEGPGYWTYGTTFNVLLIAELESVFHSDFDLSQAPGFAQTGAYPTLACGPSGLYFNYADGHDHRGCEPILFWFASRFGRPDWLRGERDVLHNTLVRSAERASSTGFMPLALLWMHEASEPRKVDLPLSWKGGGRVPIAILRSSWTDPRATFVGLKAGSPSASHGHMDIGSFVLDSDGVRWASDLGSEDYNGIESRHMNLWNSAQKSDRWTIFRLSNFGHNTLVIDDQLQMADGNAPIVEFSDRSERPFAVADLSPVYRGQAGSVRRGMMLLPSREVLIQDELTGLRPGSRVRWGMITTGSPESGLGQSILTLDKSAKRLTLTARSPTEIQWKEIDTATPRHEWDTPNPGTRMVAFEAQASKSGKLTLTVVATPGSSRAPVSAKLPIAPLDQWGGSVRH